MVKRALFRSIVGTLLLLLVNVHTADANIFRTFGFGPRAVAMGGAYTAVADDFSACHYNPAGLIAVDRTRAGLGYQSIRTDFDIDGYPRESNTDDALYMGLAMPVPFKAWLKDRIGFGFGLYQPIFYTVDLDIPIGNVPQFILLEAQPGVMVFNAALAFNVIDEGLAVGVGSTLLTDLGGALDLYPGIRGIGGSDAILTIYDQESQTIVSPTAGILFKPGRFWPALEKLTVGLTWRGEMYLDFTFPVIIVLGSIPLSLDVTSHFIHTPNQLVLGLGYRFGEKLLVAVDLSYNDWSSFSAPTLEVGISFDIPLFDIEFIEVRNDDPGFRDTLTARVGVEYLVWESSDFGLTVRGGYAFDPTPIPEQTGYTNFLDGDRHIVSTGTSVRINRIFGIDMSRARMSWECAFQYQIYARSRHRKAMAFVDPNPGYPSISGRADVFFLMTGLSFGL